MPRTSSQAFDPRSVVAVIPARFASSRFPGKMLAPLAGRPLVLHAVDNASRAASIGRVLVATDDPRIVEAVRGAGHEAILTAPDHLSGSDRIGEALTSIDAEVVVNLQGDEPLLGPSSLDRLVASLHDSPWAGVSTLACEAEPGQELDPNVVKVACTGAGRALYFSRAAIPGVHPARTRELPLLRHVGVYAYRRAVLERFLAAEPSPLELQEGLEQLRIMEMAESIVVATVTAAGNGVDTPEDLVRCEAFLARRGTDV